VKGVKPARPSLRCQAHLQFAQAPLNPKTAKEPSSPFTALRLQLIVFIARDSDTCT